MSNMERCLKISNYRNIGFEKEEKLILNHSLLNDEIGNLVILIGPNNSGKSNVLDALNFIKNSNFTDKDRSVLYYEEEKRNPSISLMCRDNDDYYEETYKYNIGREENYKIKDENKQDSKLNIDDINNALDNLFITSTNYFGYNDFSSRLASFKDVFKKSNDISEELINRMKNFVDEFRNICRNNNFTVYTNFAKNNLEFVKILNIETEESMDKKYEIRYGYKFYPQVINYKEKNINNSDLSIDRNQLSNSTFFKSIFKAINMDTKSIQNAYAQFDNFHNKSFLNKVEKEINNKINVLNKRFNTLYFLEDTKYNFSISLETNAIYFSMERGEDPIVLDYQSTGFKWFFNLYFNFLCSNNLNCGDIVVMDEPATNLHPQGQIELRKFMKEFAIKNGITIVISTHSPFLIDIDNYDELRVISMHNNLSTIDNYFTTVNEEDPDSLLPIKDSLTIRQHILYDYDVDIVFVEGITDYNYLTMFKKFLNKDKIAFLPIKGVGKTKEDQQRILKKLIEIRKSKSMLLVDGDKAGKAMQELSKGTALEVIALTDINESFKEIEYLFSDNDKEKFNVNEKSAGYSSLMKNKFTIEDFDKETIDNFAKLFGYLED